MKTTNLITLLLVLFMGFNNLYGQVPGDRYFFVQLAFADVALHSSYEQTVQYSPGGFGRSSGADAESISAPLLGAGYTYQLNRKWALNWAGDISGWRVKNFVERGLQYYLTADSPPSAIVRGAPRQFLALNTRLQFFRSIFHRPRWQISMGAGLSGMLRWHHYRSGYVYDHTIDQFEVETFTKERAFTLGVPLEIRLTIPINTHWSVGSSVGGDVYFNYDNRGFIGINVIRHWY